METWRKVWREGIAWQLPAHGLRILRLSLIGDDERLIQGATCLPLPLPNVRAPVEAADAIAFTFWQSGWAPTTEDAEDRFAKACFECDQKIGEPAGCRWFLNWYDDTPREEMRRRLLEEVDLELWRRDRIDWCAFLGLDPSVPDEVLKGYAEEAGVELTRP